MVAPISGPFGKFPSEPFADNLRVMWKQAMPVDRPLEYRMYRYYGKTQTESWDQNGYVYSPATKQANFNFSSLPVYSRLQQAAYNRAYERFRSQVSDRAGWAENIAQINKTRDTVNDRAMQLYHFTRALRKGRFNEAARVLRTPKPSGVSNRKAASQNFLEWEYGVKPVISDLQASMQILLSDHGRRKCVGGSREHYTDLQNSRVTAPNYEFQSRRVVKGFVQMTARSEVIISNPNVYLANQLGLIDLALPWKLIPFSFVVDWFVNVEQVISSVTDWYGLTLINPHTTEFRSGSDDYDEFLDTTNINGIHEGHITKYQKTSMELNRSMSIPGPTLILKPFKGFSLNRGAQAISLILAVFGK